MRLGLFADTDVGAGLDLELRHRFNQYLYGYAGGYGLYDMEAPGPRKWKARIMAGLGGEW